MGTAAVVNPYWDTLGGGERYVSSFARLLLDLGWQVDIRWPANLSGQIMDRFGIDLSPAKYVSQINSSRYQLLFWVSDGSLPVSLAKKTLIHLQFPFTQVGGTALPNYLKSRFYTFVCNSAFTKSFIDREYSVTSSVIYPPVDTANFFPGQKTKTIIYVGRFSHLTQLKNPQILTSAFKRISQQLPGWKLIIAGGVGVGSDAELLNQLKQDIKDLPATLLLNPSFTQLKQLYSSASIFWSASGFGADEQTNPTKVEHFGITPVEAMAAGCVPIITNLGGHKEIVTHQQDGFLWDTVQELETSTLNLCRHPQLLSALSASAINKSKMFSIANFNQRFSQIIK